MSQENSFVKLLEDIAILNKNSIEILSSINDLLSTNDSNVTVDWVIKDNSGNYTNSTFQMPTVGYLKSQIDLLNQNIKKLTGGEGQGSTYIIDGQTTKKIYQVDLNREPVPISNLNNIDKFESKTNWFFEELINPNIHVNFDLTGKIDDRNKKVLVRRHIVKFQVGSYGQLTETGRNSLNSFIDTFLNKSDINYDTFINWYLAQPGVVDNLDPYKYLDEDIYDINLQTLNNVGFFSVLNTEDDTIRKKFWYHLNTLTYRTKDGVNKELSINDEIIINKKESNTRYKIIEISKASSTPKIIVERVEGYDPIPVGTDVLKIYSAGELDKSVNIGVGYNEYNLVFMKPVNTDNNIIGSVWSQGSAFYTNDLVLNTDNTIDLTSYYLDNIYDYGKLLKDLIRRQTPTDEALIPNKPVLEIDNFKVVQINKHLTDNGNSKEKKDLHTRKESIKSRLNQLNDSIIEKNKELNTKQYKSIGEKNKSQNELNRLITQQESESKQYGSIVNQISNVVTTLSASPKYRLRGFFDIPMARSLEDKIQDVVAFKIQYRYSAKDGQTNPIESFDIKPTVNLEDLSGQQGLTIDTSLLTQPNLKPDPTTSGSVINNPESSSAEFTPRSSQINAPSIGMTPSPTNTVITTASGQKIPLSNQTILQTQNTNGFFSNWKEYVTKPRERSFDSTKNVWYWVVEDVANAEKPNINQVDIPIKENESIEIKVKSISEVGWPDALIESEWSDIVKIDFPDEYENTNDDSQLITLQNSQESVRVEFDNEMDAKGVYRHVRDSFTQNDSYYAHNDKTLATSFRDAQGNLINLFDYLETLTNKISSLEEQVSRAKGELLVTLFKGTTETEIGNNSETNIIVECEDYGEISGATADRIYYNNIYVIKDYYISLKNIAQNNPLGLFSDRNYTVGGTNSFFQFTDDSSCYIDADGYLHNQEDNQFLWFSDNHNGQNLYSGITESDKATAYNWLNADGGTYGSNLGLTGTTFTRDDYTFNLLTGISWTDGTLTNQNAFLSSIYPLVIDISDLIDTGQEKLKLINGQEEMIIPINLYFKFDAVSGSSFTINPTEKPVSRILKRPLKIFVETENSIRPFQFTLIFNMKQHRTANYISTQSQVSVGFQ